MYCRSITNSITDLEETALIYYITKLKSYILGNLNKN